MSRSHYYMVEKELNMKIELGNKTALSISFPPPCLPSLLLPNFLNFILKPSSSREGDWGRKILIWLLLFFPNMQMYNPIRNIRQVTEFSFPWKENISNFCSNYFAQITFFVSFSLERKSWKRQFRNASNQYAVTPQGSSKWLLIANEF